MIEGKNFLLKGSAKKTGFYTTRYVQDIGKEKAITTALNIIRQQLKNNVVKESGSNPEMFIEEIVELETFENIKVPGSGFTWFPMKE